MMDREELLRETKDELAVAQRQVLHLQQVVDGLTGLLGESGSTVATAGMAAFGGSGTLTTSTVPSGRTFLKPRDAVEQVMQSHPNTSLTPAQVFESLASRDLIDPRIKSGANAYTTALRRLADDASSHIVRDGSRYIYRAPTTVGDAMMLISQEPATYLDVT
ncbi:hypothetical protein [Lacisediminihabitans sp. H27-G8]|uniref:hypothetical protein n=1 Tax=Lacisediminihabitans sp. H27-G8 TaxID=3111909 RepID=UPI0038FD1D16